MEKITKYFKSHPTYNSTIHALGGIGVGILITYPFVGLHPVRWGLLFLAAAIVGHLYPMFAKKK